MLLLQLFDGFDPNDKGTLGAPLTMITKQLIESQHRNAVRAAVQAISVPEVAAFVASAGKAINDAYQAGVIAGIKAEQDDGSEHDLERALAAAAGIEGLEPKELEALVALAKLLGGAVGEDREFALFKVSRLTKALAREKKL